MGHRLVFAPEAEAQIVGLERYIAHEASLEIARRFVDAIVAHCEKLVDLPHLGAPRDDLRAGLRTLAFRRRVTIAYAVDESEVAIVGVYYGGQDFEAALTEHD